MGKKSKAPPAPDYAGLAKQQAVEQAALLKTQTEANRPTQNTPWGSSSWAQDPAGKWTENISLAPAEQQQLEAQRRNQASFDETAGGLLGQAHDSLSKPLDFSGLPQADPGFGAVQEVQDAMMGRLRPELQRNRDSEVQRLRNQGIFENTEAFDRAMERSDQASTDANQRALLGATQAYGDIFNRTQGARQQGITEQNMIRQSPLNDIMKLQGQDVSSPAMPSFATAGQGQATDLVGAADKSYQAAMDAYNAKQARSGGIMSGLMGLGGSILGGPMGGMAGKWIGSKFGG